MTKGILNKVLRVKNNMDKHLFGGYAELSMDYICNYLAWLHKYHKLPKAVIDYLVVYATFILDFSMVPAEEDWEIYDKYREQSQSGWFEKFLKDEIHKERKYSK